MCNIVLLPAGSSPIPYDKFENMVYNNPHGFGLILKDSKNKKLQVIRRCPEKGNDPKEIYDLIEDNKDIERYLHVRWRTDGPVNLENTHPFPAYISDRRQIYFMHNGILHDFKPSGGSITWVDNVRKEVGKEDISDSKKFNDEFLAPFLLTHSGENGKADINDPIFQKIIHKFWSSDSKGVLISNDLDPVLINTKAWKEMDFGSGKFWSSNDTYYNNLVRGPEKERREKLKREKEEKERSARFQSQTVSRISNSNNAITELKDLNLEERKIKTEELSNILEDYDIWTEDGMASLDNLTHLEMEALIDKAPAEAVNLLLSLTGYYAQLYQKYTKLKRYADDLKFKGKSDIKEDEI